MTIDVFDVVTVLVFSGKSIVPGRELPLSSYRTVKVCDVSPLTFVACHDSCRSPDGRQ